MSVTHILGSDKAIRLNNFNTLGLVQNFSWAPNFNAQDVFELGRTTKLDTQMELETSGSFELMGTGNLAGLLARMKPRFTGSDFVGFQFSGSTNVNAYTYTQDDLSNLYFDVIQHEKTEQSTFNRSTYLGCCYPTSFSGRVDAAGMATDTVNWSGQFVVGFPSPYHDIQVLPLTRTGTNTLSVTGVSAVTHTLAYVTIDGRVFRTTATDPQYATLATSVVTMTNVTVPVGAVCTAVFYKTTAPATAWSGVHTPNTIGTAPLTDVYGIRGFQASVFIAPATAGTPASSEQWLRVQSFDYSVDMRVEALRQIAQNAQGTAVYLRYPTYPLNISVNATVTESDWQDWKAMLKGTVKTFTGSNIYENTYDFSANSLKDDFAVVVQYFTKAGTLIQQLEFGDLRVDGMGMRANVGGRSEVSWSFRGTAFKVTGSNIA